MTKLEARGSQPGSEMRRGDLYVQWTQQTTRFLELGFHRQLKYPSSEAYLDSLLPFSPQVPEFAERFDNSVPLVIDPRIPLARLAEMCGVRMNVLGDEVISDWPGNNFVTPPGPYTVWVGTRMEIQRRNRAIPVMRRNLLPDERGATVIEAVYFHLNNPGFIGDPDDEDIISRYIAMIGSQDMKKNGEEMRVYLGLYGGEPTITNNGDSANDPNASLEALIVAR